MKIPIQPFPHHEGLPLPRFGTDMAVGADLYASLPEDTVWHVPAGCSALVPLGFAIAIPWGFEGQIRPRSGLAVKHHISVLNTPGTIDPDYRGEVKVVIFNHGITVFDIKRGDRIAQLVIAPVPQVEFEQVDSLPPTTRGAGGFGSTGV